MHSSWPRATTTTEEPLEEAKSWEESEEKHKQVAPSSSFGILDTCRRRGDEGEGGGGRGGEGGGGTGGGGGGGDGGGRSGEGGGGHTNPHQDRLLLPL